MFEPAGKKVAFVLYSDPMIYPPTMNAAAILAEHGMRVDIFCKRYPTQEEIPVPEGVRLLYRGPLRRGLQLRGDFACFCLRVAREAAKRKYAWVFSYDMMGSLPGYLASRAARSRWVYHNHDITSVSRRLGFYAALKALERRCARRADAVVFPQRRRAAMFAEEANLSASPLIVMNGPRRRWAHVDRIDAEVSELKRRWGKVVIYQGGLNWKRGLRKAIESMPFWRPEAALCLIGKSDLEPSFPNQARQLARSLGVGERLLVKPVVPYHLLPMVTRACDVGVGVLSTTDDASLNVKLLAGASNKLAEYMACGLPVVVPHTGEYRRYVAEPGLGVVVDPADPRAIAKGINSLLGNETLRQRIARRAVKAFRERLNYDVQFQPVLDMVKNGCETAEEGT